MDVHETAFARGIASTRGTLAEWNRAPWQVLRGWLAVSVSVAAAMLIGVWLVSVLAPHDPTPVVVPGIGSSGGFRSMAWILANNLVVLALHATACVAGFIAGASMPAIAAEKSGFSRRLHLNAGRIAILMVVAITAMSVVVQTYALGLQGASLSSQLDISQAALIASVIPHAIPELTAIFMPLAAWTLASRRDQWDQLLAATLVTVSLAIPVLIVAAVIEVQVWPLILELISPSIQG